jgi:hypothetical protein
MKTYHLRPATAGWQLTLEGFDDPVELYLHHTQAEALHQALDAVTSSGDPAALRIHHPDGTLAEEHTYPTTPAMALAG